MTEDEADRILRTPYVTHRGHVYTPDGRYAEYDVTFPAAIDPAIVAAVRGARVSWVGSRIEVRGPEGAEPYPCPKKRPS